MPSSIHALEKNKKIESGYKTEIPNESSLLLRPRFDNIIFDYDIYSFVKDGTLYYSLVDIIDVFELAIDFDEETQKGKGWFLREDWKFTADLKNNNITTKGKSYVVSDQDVVFDKGLTLISQKNVEKWLEIKFVPDIEQQYLTVESKYPLPAVARHQRQKKDLRSESIDNVAQLPRHPIEYDWFDLNTANIRLSTQHKKRANESLETTARGTITTEGQVLKHEAYVLLGLDNEIKPNFVVSRLSKKDEAGELLGPLKAYQYALGDTDLVNVPLTGDSRQELGFRVSNRPFDDLEFNTTDISGNALPGWDVELYQNNILTLSTVIGDDGFYEFPDIQLFGGDNIFELFFYGPQGEIRRKEINVPVTPKLLSSDKGTYDVSVSLSDTRTYQANNDTSLEDQGTPHIAALYNKSFGRTFTQIGLRNRDVAGENKSFLGAGFTRLFGDVIITGQLGVDDNFKTAAQLTGNKKIKKWNVSLSSFIQDEDYAPIEISASKILQLNGSAQRSFVPVRGTRANLSTSVEYNKTADNDKVYLARLGTSVQQHKFNISNNLFYQRNIQDSGLSTTRMDNNLSFRRSFKNMFVRAGLNYNVEPNATLDRFFGQFNYYPNDRFTGDVLVEYQPEQDFRQLRFSLNYINDYMRTSPFIEFGSRDEVLAGVNLSFNLVDVPKSNAPLLTSKRSIGRGLVSSFVYHDKNGNYAFDDDDEALPDVTVESVNVKRRVDTNDKGYSLIHNLPTRRATDIQLDNYSLPDPYMIAAKSGVSVFPSAGEIVELDFPVHMSGEIDGTISVRDKRGDTTPLKRADVVLYPVTDPKKNGHEKKIKAETALDGFYVASQVPPGKYIMTVSNETAKRVNASLPPPRVIDIGHEGEALYGYNFELDKAKANVPIDVIYGHNESLEILYGLKVDLEPKTKLLKLLGDLKQQNNKANILVGLQEVGGEREKQKIYKLPNNDLQKSHKKCQEFATRAMPCTLQIYLPSGVKAVKTAQTILR